MSEEFFWGGKGKYFFLGIIELYTARAKFLYRVADPGLVLPRSGSNLRQKKPGSGDDFKEKTGSHPREKKRFYPARINLESLTRFDLKRVAGRL